MMRTSLIETILLVPFYFIALHIYRGPAPPLLPAHFTPHCGLAVLSDGHGFDVEGVVCGTSLGNVIVGKDTDR